MKSLTVAFVWVSQGHIPSVYLDYGDGRSIVEIGVAGSSKHNAKVEESLSGFQLF